MVADWKLRQVEELSKKISESKTVAVVGILGIPSKQFQLMRKKLRDKLQIYVSKKSIIKKALEKSKLSKIVNEVEGSTALLLSELDPLQVNSLIEENKTFAPLKPGDKAPYDIVIPAGETSLRAGPILAELQKVGIKAQIKSGKIFVTENSVVAKANNSISKELAAILPRLNVFPKEISFSIRAIYNNGLIYSRDVLMINKNVVNQKINSAIREAINLSLNLNFYTKYTVKLFIQRAYNETLNLALNAEIPTKETIPYLLQKANFQAKEISSKLKV
ncbi:MAG: 50S ribosomal protein L10 [Candidatus Altiarchaeota archaeon]